MKHFLAAAACLLCAAASAQQLNKCRDAAGKVTYASQECEVLGLKPAGDIQNRTSVAPAPRKPPPEPVESPNPDFKKDAAAAAAKPAPDERRCFKTAKGTRCNDVPDEKSQ